MMPEGTYWLLLQRHPQLGHQAIRIQRLSTKSSTQAWLIHVNGVHGTTFGASIVIGEYLVPGVVIRSYPYFERLLKRIEKAINRRIQVELTITQPR